MAPPPRDPSICYHWEGASTTLIKCILRRVGVGKTGRTTTDECGHVSSSEACTSKHRFIIWRFARPVKLAVERRLLLVLVGSKRLEVWLWRSKQGWIATNQQARFGNKSPPCLYVVIFQPYFMDNPTAPLCSHHTSISLSQWSWECSIRRCITANPALMSSLAGVACRVAIEPPHAADNGQRRIYFHSIAMLIPSGAVSRGQSSQPHCGAIE